MSHRRRLAALLALLLSLASASRAAAISPDPKLQADPWAQNRVLEAHWSTSDAPPDWMQTPFLAAMDDASTTRASKGPTYSYDSAGEGSIAYMSGVDSGCGDGSLACTHRSVSTDSWWIHFVFHGTVYGDPWNYTVRWCDKPSSGSPCKDVERVGLHELAHVDNLGHNPVDDESMTIMYYIVPSVGQTGSETHTLLSCEKARLQVMYDVLTTSSTYASCLAGLSGAGADGLLTDVTFATTSTFLCLYDTATFSGALHVQDLSSYGSLGGNALGSRTVDIQRSVPGAGNFSDYTNDGTSSSGAWSKGLSFGVNTDYDWRSQFDSESGLNNDNSTSMHVRWSSSC